MLRVGVCDPGRNHTVEGGAIVQALGCEEHTVYFWHYTGGCWCSLTENVLSGRWGRVTRTHTRQRPRELPGQDVSCFALYFIWNYKHTSSDLGSASSWLVDVPGQSVLKCGTHEKGTDRLLKKCWGHILQTVQHVSHATLLAWIMCVTQ